MSFPTYDNLGMTNALKRGRSDRQKIMTSSCTITRPGERIFDELAGTYTHSPGVVIYEGRCQFKTVSPVGQRTGDVAGREMTQVMYELVLPYDEDAHGISVSDSVVVDSGPITYHVYNTDRSRDRIATHITVVDQDRGDVDWA